MVTAAERAYRLRSRSAKTAIDATRLVATNAKSVNALWANTRLAPGWTKRNKSGAIRKLRINYLTVHKTYAARATANALRVTNCEATAFRHNTIEETGHGPAAAAVSSQACEVADAFQIALAQTIVSAAWRLCDAQGLTKSPTSIDMQLAAESIFERVFGEATEIVRVGTAKKAKKKPKNAAVIVN